MFDLDIRLVEEVKEKCNGVSLQNEDVYMNAGFEDFASCVIRRFRGIEDKEPFTYDAVSSLTHDHKIIRFQTYVRKQIFFFVKNSANHIMSIKRGISFVK